MGWSSVRSSFGSPRSSYRAPSGRRRPRPRFAPRVERLEDRWVPCFTLRFEQAGFAPLDILDNEAGDADGALGHITVPGGTTYGTFTLIDDVHAHSKPAVGDGVSEASLTLDQVFVSTGTGGTLVVSLADTDFNFPATTTDLQSHLDPFPPNALAAPAGSSIAFQSWANANNLSPLHAFPTAIPSGSVTPGRLGPYGPGDPGGSTSTAFSRGSGPYSLFCQMTIVLAGCGTSCFVGHTHVTGDSCPPYPPPPPPPPPEHLEGRMTGGGSIFTPEGTRVTHGFELHCNVAIEPNNLQVNIHTPQRDRFHLEDMISAVCTDDPAIDPAPPPAPIDTYDGYGTGRLNGESGWSIRFRFTDAGEPGRDDEASYLIWQDSDSDGNLDPGEPVALNVGPTPLTFGNHQAHAENKSPTPTQGTWQAHSNTQTFKDYWPPTGLAPTQHVKTVFSRAGSAPYSSLGNDSLVTALGYAGGNTLLGAAQNLLRVGTAAMLDASHPYVSYALTPNDIRSQVNAALNSQNVATITSLAGSLTESDALRHWQIPTEPLRAGGAAAGTADGAPVLTEELLQPIFTEAIARWQAAGVPGESLDTLAQFHFAITDLPDGYLGVASASLIQLDVDAAGHGWFIDATPGDDSEFVLPGDQGEQGRVDLLTVVAHEIGHALGLEHSDGGVMEEELAPGVRHPLGCGCPGCAAAVAALSESAPAGDFATAATFTAPAAASVPADRPRAEADDRTALALGDIDWLAGNGGGAGLTTNAAQSPAQATVSSDPWHGDGIWPGFRRVKGAGDSFADPPADGAAGARLRAARADATDAPEFGLKIGWPNLDDATDDADFFWMGIRLPVS